MLPTHPALVSMDAPPARSILWFPNILFGPIRASVQYSTHVCSILNIQAFEG